MSGIALPAAWVYTTRLLSASAEGGKRGPPERSADPGSTASSQAAETARGTEAAFFDGSVYGDGGDRYGAGYILWIIEGTESTGAKEKGAQTEDYFFVFVDEQVSQSGKGFHPDRS